MNMREEGCPASERRIRDDKSADFNQSPNAAREDRCLEWIGSNDPTNPKNFSNARKWAIAGALMLGTLLIPMNGTSITAATAEIAAHFNVSNDSFPNVYWTVTSWSLGGAVFLVIGMPLMEDLGVRRTFLVSYAFFILMIIPQALATNFATLVVTRALSGGCVALLACVAASVIPDLWANERERSLPVSIWVLCYLLGNTLGPPTYAAILQSTGNWRWIFYAQLIIYGSLFPVFWLLLRETRSDVVLRRQAKALSCAAGQKDMGGGGTDYRQLGKATFRPIYLLFTEPLLLASTIWSGFSFGTVYLFTQSIAQVYQTYGWNDMEINYVQVAVAVGEVLGWMASLYGTRLYFQSASRNTETPGHPIPEARLYVSVFGSLVGIAGGMFVYAWTTSFHWIYPTIGLAMVGFGSQVVVSAVADYLEDAYAASNYAASAISACAAGEDIIAGILPLATLRMYDTLGNQWASTLLAFLAVLLSIAPVLIIWKGRWLRERSPFMLSNGQSSSSES